MDNRYGKTSKLDLTMERRDDKTILSDVFFTAPFKIIKPFYDKDYMQVMQISVSAGIMEGDKQEISIKALENSKSEIISQAYEKIHKMENGFAQRNIEIEIGANSELIYNPLPVIPFKNSAFKNSLSVNLKDSSSKFILNEILTCGRVYSGEKFEYKFYNSRVCVRENGRLVFMDNSRYSLDRTNMSNIGMYEGYTNLFNFVVFNYDYDMECLKNSVSVFCNENKYIGGVTTGDSNSLVIKILGDNADRLLKYSERLVEYFKKYKKWINLNKKIHFL